MLLLTKEIKRRMPELYHYENLDPSPPTADYIVQAKFFTPDSNWTWYAVEGNAVLEDGSEIPLVDSIDRQDVVDVLFFGWVHGFEKEWGYFLLSELENARGPLGLKIERDLYFGTPRIGEI